MVERARVQRLRIEPPPGVDDADVAALIIHADVDAVLVLRGGGVLDHVGACLGDGEADVLDVVVLDAELLHRVADEAPDDRHRQHIPREQE